MKLWLAGKLKEGTESAVAWKAVEKNELLESRDLSLSAEKFLGGTVSNSGDLPIVELGEIVDELESGVSVNSENRETTEGEIGILKTSCVTSGIFQPEQHKAVLSAEVSQVRCPVRRNSIIISRMNTEALVGANAYVAKDFPHLFLPDRLWQTVISRQDVEVRYVQAVLASQASRNRISAMCNGTSGSMKNISKSQLLSLPIPLPPLEEQRRIVAEIEGYQKVLDGARQILAGYRPQVDLDPECESEAFEAICTTITPPKKILATDFGVEGRYPIIDQSQDAIAGYTNDETALIDATLGLVIFGDHTCAVKCVQEPFAQGADGIKIIQTETGLLPKFLFYYLTSHPIEQEGYKRHYSKLKTLEIPVPDLEEQRRIVAELDAEAAQMEAVRSLIPRFEGKIQRVLDRVWGTTVQAV